MLRLWRWADTALERALSGILLVLLVGPGLATSGAPRTYAFTVSSAPAAAADDTLAALSPWDGSINLYRTGVFSTQKTWYYCTAADVQIMRNIVFHEERHGRAAQDRYFAYMRDHMRYRIPLRDGVDPAGWTAGLRHFVDDRYRLVRSSTFGSLLRSAVRSLRRTNLPVALFVDHGNHGWVLHGFTATADPAVTRDFTVTSVRVSGPLWGLQNATYGYDMHPNKKLSRGQLRDFVTRWHYARIHMVYEGEFLSIQPIGPAPLTATAAPLPADPATSGPSPTIPASQGPPVDASPSLPDDPSPTPTSELGLAPDTTQTPEPAPAGVMETRPPGEDDAARAAPALLVLLAAAGMAGAMLLHRSRSPTTDA